MTFSKKKHLTDEILIFSLNFVCLLSNVTNYLHQASVGIFLEVLRENFRKNEKEKNRKKKLKVFEN